MIDLHLIQWLNYGKVNVRETRTSDKNVTHNFATRYQEMCYVQIGCDK